LRLSLIEESSLFLRHALFSLSPSVTLLLCPTEPSIPRILLMTFLSEVGLFPSSSFALSLFSLTCTLSRTHLKYSSYLRPPPPPLFEFLTAVWNVKFSRCARPSRSFHFAVSFSQRFPPLFPFSSSPFDSSPFRPFGSLFLTSARPLPHPSSFNITKS